MKNLFKKSLMLSFFVLAIVVFANTHNSFAEEPEKSCCSELSEQKNGCCEKINTQNATSIQETKEKLLILKESLEKSLAKNPEKAELPIFEPMRKQLEIINKKLETLAKNKTE